MPRFVQFLQHSGVYAEQNFMIVPRPGFNLVCLRDSKDVRWSYDGRLQVDTVGFDDVEGVALEYINYRYGKQKSQERDDQLLRLRTALFATAPKDRDGEEVVSLLDSTVLDRIGKEALTVTEEQPASAFAPAKGGKPIPYLADPLHLYMTVSNLRGVPYRVAFEGADHDYGMLSHGDRVHYVLRGLGAESTRSSFAEKDPGIELKITSLPKPGGKFPDEWSQYIQAALASSAFPLGLAPRRLECSSADYEGRRWPLHVDLADKLKPEKAIDPAWPLTLKFLAPVSPNVPRR